MDELKKLTEELTAIMSIFLENAALSTTNNRGSVKARKVMRKVTSNIKTMGIKYRALSVQADKDSKN